MLEASPCPPPRCPSPNLTDRVQLFNNRANDHQQNQALNPFSTDSSVKGMIKPTFSKEEYGRPIKGSKSEKRGQIANAHIFGEMRELCEVIHENGAQFNEQNTQKIIYFGELFNLYTLISGNVVGILLRARKHGLVEFEGEVLFQRRDDNVPIVLLKPIQEIRRELKKHNHNN